MLTFMGSPSPPPALSNHEPPVFAGLKNPTLASWIGEARHTEAATNKTNAEIIVGGLTGVSRQQALEDVPG